MNRDDERAAGSGGNRNQGSTSWSDSSGRGASDESTLEGLSAKAKQLASDSTENVTQHAKRLLDDQLGTGADFINRLASATRKVSEELKAESPQVAGLINTMAERVDAYSDQLRDQSVSDLWHAANSYARRQPALVFGLAALAGFFALRVVKAAPVASSSTPSRSSPSIQPYQTGPSRQSNGVRTH